MKQLLSNLIGFTVSSLDDNVGVVRDFYFDDHHWKLRYLVCALRPKSGRRTTSILIPAEFLVAREWDLPIFPVNLTSAQIDQCPSVESDLPVSRQKALEVASTLLWPEHGGVGTGMVLMTPIPHKMGKPGDPRLRSFQVVRRYHLESSRGILGAVRDFVVDDTGRVHSLIVRLGPWYHGHVVLASPSWAHEIDWARSTIWTQAHPAEWASAPPFSSRHFRLPLRFPPEGES